jgi:hypothetical protein
MSRTRRYAREHGLSLEATFELGLQLVLDGRAKAQSPFKLRKKSVSGQGLTD